MADEGVRWAATFNWESSTEKTLGLIEEIVARRAWSRTARGGRTLTTWGRFAEDKINTLVASVVFLFTLAVYTITMTPTVPFWDSGEYIATSYILGVPHAPGTPLYVLLGRMFTLIPIGTIAQRVNWFSALSSAIAVLFTYLITVQGDLAQGLPRPSEHS